MSMCSLSLVVVLSAVVGSVEYEIPHNAEISTLSFPRNHWTTTSISNDISHLQPDQYVIGNILFADGSSMKTTDGKEINGVVGNAEAYGYKVGIGTEARFDWITGFYQLTASETVIVDHNNHCLRHVNRSTGIVSTYAGICGQVGMLRLNQTSSFYKPWDVIKDNMQVNSTLIVSDQYNKALRLVCTQDHSSTTIPTLIQSNLLYAVRALVQTPNIGDLFMVNNHGIVRYDYGRKTLTVISGAIGRRVQGYVDGSFTSSLFSYPWDLTLLTASTLVIADSHNGRLRILNMTSGTSSSICSGSAEVHSDGNLDNCTMNRPSSVMLFNNTLFVGELGHIRIIPVNPLKSSAVTSANLVKTTYPLVKVPELGFCGAPPSTPAAVSSTSYTNTTSQPLSTTSGATQVSASTASCCSDTAEATTVSSSANIPNTGYFLPVCALIYRSMGF